MSCREHRFNSGFALFAGIGRIRVDEAESKRTAIIISRIEIGDMVKGYDGKSLKVINIVQGMEECLVEIKTSDGKHLRLTDSHPILKNNIWDSFFANGIIAGDIVRQYEHLESDNSTKETSSMSEPR